MVDRSLWATAGRSSTVRAPRRRAGDIRAGPSRAGPSRAGPSRAGTTTRLSRSSLRRRSFQIDRTHIRWAPHSASPVLLQRWLAAHPQPPRWVFPWTPLRSRRPPRRHLGGHLRWAKSEAVASTAHRRFGGHRGRGDCRLGLHSDARARFAGERAKRRRRAHAQRNEQCGRGRRDRRGNRTGESGRRRAPTRRHLSAGSASQREPQAGEAADDTRSEARRRSYRDAGYSRPLHHQRRSLRQRRPNPLRNHNHRRNPRPLHHPRSHPACSTRRTSTRQGGSGL